MINKGQISQITGTIIDVYFEKKLPNLKHALKIEGTDVVLEVMAHVGENSVRTIAMSSR